MGIYTPCESVVASEMPTTRASNEFSPVVSVSNAITSVTDDKNLSSASTVVIVSDVNFLSCDGAAGAGVSTLHTEPANSNGCGAGPALNFSIGNNFSILAAKELLSNFSRTKFNAAGVLNTNGVIFSPDKSTSDFNVTN